ncbi:MAG TPA: efflux RND transporter periplasmic adaptor subunit [Gemmatimonadales bacterium]|nr:efflux RND transporter periplasmic adaptor subunit [Gemmatimonadales bacterium]
MTSPAHDLSKLRIDREPPPPRHRALGRILVFVGAAITIGMGSFLFLRGRRAVVVQTVVAAPMAANASLVEEGSVTVTANGYVVARTRAAVSAKIAGRLATQPLDGGTFVRKGEVIARLENADYAAAVEQARANLATARAQLAEAESDRDQAKRESDRIARIRAERPDLMSPQDAEAADARTAQALSRATAAAARVDAAAAGLRLAQVTLENTVIRAPFTGTVLRKEAEVGEVVAPSVGGGLTRGAVVTMADLSTLEVEVDVNEAYIARVKNGQPARITLDAYPDTAFRGRVRQVVPTADRQRATVQVKVSILDRDPRILPEMGSRVDFLAPAPPRAARPATAETAPPRFRLPASAVRESGGKTVVWLVRDGRLAAKEVEAGPVSGGFREVRSGLAGGELILSGGVETPVEGMKVVTGP